ncbi:ImmA/IrrE family metallo-endopeptidase [Pseudomonas sp. JUb96]|uniref:ImmA/IrrE family metallo-endopeptidase n=1 Tax=Pseudomonas sp. JUb96 TaxID=2940539 RepID=UPI0022280DD5|nr:ImmA/IrrE family metallo-endopeptidase [Pseudomonas sp. JUb96]MCW2272410.1 Zn-dependent peptidase ImmA (M78 family) [Pseudomonas sp. JUb96]
MDTLNVSPALLDWAASQIGKTLQDLATLVVSGKGIDRFVAGELTVRQLEKVAKVTHTPFGYLLLDSPPSSTKPRLPDMRQVVSPDPLGPDFFEVLDDVIAKQNWYLDYLHEIGADPLPFVGSFSTSDDPCLVAKRITEAAGIDYALKKSCSSQSDYFRALSESFESIGILVFKNSIVKSNSRRGLSVSEFRGFAICNEYAPAVFINGKDAEAAWIFTLAHEVAHLWIGESGVSDIPSPKDFMPGKNVESFCNSVAAEMLVPKDEFLSLWSGSDSEALDRSSRHFKVSKLVVGRRAFELGKISRSAYSQLYALSYKAGGSGGNPYATIPVRNSKKVTSALVKSAMEGSILIRDAARLLNITPDTVTNLYKKNIRAHA